MSHRALNWALEQRQVKPGPWRVLVMLADRHNKDTRQVNPDQYRLAEDCAMSRASVNRHLEQLEEMGLLRRVPRRDPVSKRQLSTWYILGLDFANPPHVDNAVSQIATRVAGDDGEGENENISAGRVSECDTEPCLKNGESRVSKNAIPVSQIETLTMEGNQEEEPCAAGASDFEEENGEGGKTGTVELASLLERFLAVYPRTGNRDAVQMELAEAVEAGADPEHILAAARAYAAEQKGNPPRFIAYPDNWIAQRRWEQFAAPSAPASEERVLENLAKMVISGKSYAARAIKPNQARALLAAGLVTGEQLRAAGVAA